jgi:hypothetical protein
MPTNQEPVNNYYTADLTSRVSVLEDRVVSIATSIDKIESKMDNNYAVLHSRISDLRDDLRDDFEKKNDNLLSKLEQHSLTSQAQNAVIMEKIGDGDKWRWMILGGSVVIGYVLAHIKLENLF